MSEGTNIIVAALADRGKVRESNEDRSFYLKFDLPGDEGPGLLAAVADGMGGHAAGEAASERAIQVLHSRINGLASSEASPDSIDWVSFITEAFHEANAEVHQESKRWAGRKGMGTTLTAVTLVGEQLHIGHVGDSRAYLIREDGIIRLTDDDTWTAEQVRRGLMTEEQAASSEHAGQLTRVMGFKPAVDVSTHTRRLSPGDVLLLCTDGLSTVVSDQEILSMLVKAATPQSACERLISLANRKGGPDNVAVIVISYRPEVVARRKAPSPGSARKKMIAGLAAVLLLLSVDVAYLASQYSKAPKPHTSTVKAKFKAPVTVTVKPVATPDASPSVSPDPQPPSEPDAVLEEDRPEEQTPPVDENQWKDESDIRSPEERPNSELTIKDLSGGVVTLGGGGDKH